MLFYGLEVACKTLEVEIIQLQDSFWRGEKDISEIIPLHPYNTNEKSEALIVCMCICMVWHPSWDHAT